MKYDRIKLGRNIRILRRKQGISAEKLAGLIGVTPAYVRITERGERGMVAEKLYRIAEILEVTFSELSEGNFSERDAIIKVNEDNKASIREKINSYLNSMSGEQLELALQFVINTLSSDESQKSESDDIEYN